MIKSRKALGALAVGLMGAGVLGACAPAPAPVIPVGDTTTTNVLYACAGAGLIGPGQPNAVPPIADQTTSVAITLPSAATAGSSVAVAVDVGNLNLAAAPGFINLNQSGIVASIAVAGANDPALVAVTNFVGNGASLDLNAAGTTDTAAAGSNTVTVGTISILSGSTGFVCTPVGTPASASYTAT